MRWLAVWLLTGALALAEPVRVATWNAELQRDGPGLLLRDLVRFRDGTKRAEPDIVHAHSFVTSSDADILVLQGFDWDLDGHAISAFAEITDYAHWYASRPNSGWQTGLDVDGDRRLGEPEDALGYGAFTGQAGMAVLSRWPITLVADYTSTLWRDVPDALLPEPNDDWPSQEVYDQLPLVGVAQWVLRVDTSDGPLTVMTWHGTPPVFDGPEDRNGRRNHDQTAFWQMLLDGDISFPAAGTLGDCREREPRPGARRWTG